MSLEVVDESFVVTLGVAFGGVGLGIAALVSQVLTAMKSNAASTMAFRLTILAAIFGLGLYAECLKHLTAKRRIAE